ncbi:MAG: DNA primase [Capsulimonadaceae bacterium]
MAERSEIEEVRLRTDLVATIEQYVTLKRAGRNLKGLCPFHSEKTPSFTVNPDVGRFKCFGCGESGDVITFVQKIENLTFHEALERLALRAGITLSRPDHAATRPGAPAEVSERDRIYRANGVALRYYRDMLTLSEAARQYLDERCIDPETQAYFSLGYAPEAWDGLTTTLQKQKIPIADAELAGLVSRSERGKYYDRMRGRLVFPIFDVQERPVAFGGRLLGPSAAGQPKYWNSPEHPAFIKGRTLYGLEKARKGISSAGCSLIVEGYTDVISAHHAGFTNVVAPLGTALTEDHVRILARLAPAVMLCFDADSAGLKAAFRAAEIFEANEVTVTVLELPDGEDPDSLLRAGREEEFRLAIANAVSMVEYRIGRLLRTHPRATDADRVTIMRKSLPILGAIGNVVERDRYIRQVAPAHPAFRFGAAAAEDQLRQDVDAYLAVRAARATGRRSDPRVERPPQPPIREAADRADMHLLRALLSGDPALSGPVLAGIRPDEFATDNGKALAAVVYRVLSEQPLADAAKVIDSARDTPVAEALTALVMGDEEPMSTSQVDEEISYLRRKSAGQERSRLLGLINSGAAGADDYARYTNLILKLKGSERVSAF